MRGMGQIRPKRVPGTYPMSGSLDSLVSDGTPGPVRNRSVPDKAMPALIGPGQRPYVRSTPVIGATDY